MYSLLIPTNPSYPIKNAGSWQTSPSMMMIPPRGSGRSTTRLCPTETRLCTSFTQVFLLCTRDFVDNVFSSLRFPSVPATTTTTTTTRTVTQRLPPPVSSLTPVPSRHPPRRSHPHLSLRPPDRHPIIRLPSSSLTVKSHTRATHRGSLLLTLSDDPATSMYPIDDASVSRENDSQADSTRQSDQPLGESLGSDFDIRVHDDRD